MRIGFLEIRRLEDRPIFVVARGLERKHERCMRRERKKVRYIKTDGEWVSREACGEDKYDCTNSR